MTYQIQCNFFPIQDELYNQYRSLYSGLKLLVIPLARYNSFTAAEWRSWSWRERSELADRLSNFIQSFQSTLQQLERRTKSTEDVQRIRKKIKCLLETINIQLGSLTHILHTSFFESRMIHGFSNFAPYSS